MGFIEMLYGAGLALAATSFGSFAVVLFRQDTIKKYYPLILSFCAGVMTFSIGEMLNASHIMFGDLFALLGFTLGSMLLVILERLLPHSHIGVNTPSPHSKRKTAMIVGAITLHNIPEGFAIASAFAGSASLGWLVTASIAFQDIPEGLIVSTPLLCYGLMRHKCINLGILSGVVEFASAALGYVFLSAITPAIPFALAFSAGAMLYVVVEELLPDALKGAKRHIVASSFIIGIALAFLLSCILGF